ncbi:MAG TPA: MFS transporter [Gemmatimonadales bacterium]|nr:MFS transporter [Gemmatimonadales bacterium]
MEKPRLSVWQIWNMSFGFLGIQFGFALQNANVSRIFQTLGANVDSIPILWVAAPFTGLVVQPIVGYFSDRTWNRLGRRRPYFLTGAILASLALILMPNSPALWVAAGMLWIMDASINISMEPFRAFVGDNLAASQRVTGFALQSFFIGTGAVVASLLPWMLTNWLGVANEAPAGQIPPSVRYSFYLGAAAFLTAVVWTVVSSKEYSPQEMKSFSEPRGPEETLGTAASAGARVGGHLIKLGVVYAIGGVLLTVALALGSAYQVLVLSVGGFIFGILLIVAGALMRNRQPPYGAFVTILNDLLDMPRTMKQLAWAQFFSWFALFAMWIYTTTAVTSHIYHTTDTTSALYNQGANWVGVCFAVYNGVAAVVAFGIPPLARWSSPKMAHIVCLACGGLGLLSITMIGDPKYLLVSMIGVGIAWASILSMPYAILTGALPPAKLGYYMGVFNFFIVIPQIVAAAILGYLVKHFFGGDTLYAIVVGGASLFLAALLMLRVKEN